MLIDFFNWFVKITAYPVQKLIFRTKVYYQDKNVQSRHIKGAAIVISNHTSVFDYAVYLFVFFTRTLRVQMAEVHFDNKPLGLFLKMLGGIYVNRDVHNFDFINKSEKDYLSSELNKVNSFYNKVNKESLAAAADSQIEKLIAGGRFCIFSFLIVSF